jgi:Flp pilus assembly protein TadD
LLRASTLDPKNPDASYDLGKALLAEGDAEGAVAALGRAAELEPDNPNPHYQLARALEKAGNKEQSLHELQVFAALKKAQPATGGMAAGPVP